MSLLPEWLLTWAEFRRSGVLCYAYGGTMPDSRTRVCAKRRGHLDSHAYEFLADLGHPEQPFELPGTITEHATEMSGGGMHVWNEEPSVTAIYPTARKIRNEQANGTRVWRRKIVVIEGWHTPATEYPS